MGPSLVIKAAASRHLSVLVFGIAVLLLARPLCNWILHRWNLELEYHKLHWLRSPEPITRTAAATGAFIGTYSHVLLDSIMHADMLPLRPLTADNALLGG